MRTRGSSAVCGSGVGPLLLARPLPPRRRPVDLAGSSAGPTRPLPRCCPPAGGLDVPPHPALPIRHLLQPPGPCSGDGYSHRCSRGIGGGAAARLTGPRCRGSSALLSDGPEGLLTPARKRTSCSRPCPGLVDTRDQAKRQQHARATQRVKRGATRDGHVVRAAPTSSASRAGRALHVLASSHPSTTTPAPQRACGQSRTCFQRLREGAGASHPGGEPPEHDNPGPTAGMSSERTYFQRLQG